MRFIPDKFADGPTRTPEFNVQEFGSTGEPLTPPDRTESNDDDEKLSVPILAFVNVAAARFTPFTVDNAACEDNTT